MQHGKALGMGLGTRLQWSKIVQRILLLICVPPRNKNKIHVATMNKLKHVDIVLYISFYTHILLINGTTSAIKVKLLQLSTEL